jgi:catechol 2,3-dioxygenase-like lactoylglutathione lyase family enzyme
MRIVINIDVPELASAIDFYTAALGLQLSRVLDDDVAELAGASSTIYLLAKGAESASSNSGEEKRRYSRHWTPVHIDFVVPELAAAVERAVGAGAR